SAGATSRSSATSSAGRSGGRTRRRSATASPSCRGVKMPLNGNDERPDPNPLPLPLVPPYVNSVYNIITRRLRLARTIFGDRIKLVLRQYDETHWSYLTKPYLLVVPRQTRAPRNVDIDYMAWDDPREVTLVAQFDGRGSEAEYLAANDIDTAE